MKRGKKVLLIVGIVLVVLVGMMAIAAFSGMGYVRKMTVNPVDLTTVADGRYKGSFSQGRFSYSVEVTVKDHRIVAVEPASSQTAVDAVVGQIYDRIVADQAVDVDTVAGASLTTKAVAKAVENALSLAP